MIDTLPAGTRRVPSAGIDTATIRPTRAVNSIVTIPSHEDARHHAARTEAADQAIASLLGSATRRRFAPSRRLDLDAELLADIALLV
jgi:hypothetical protein